MNPPKPLTLMPSPDRQQHESQIMQGTIVVPGARQEELDRMARVEQRQEEERVRANRAFHRKSCGVPFIFAPDSATGYSGARLGDFSFLLEIPEEYRQVTRWFSRLAAFKGPRLAMSATAAIIGQYGNGKTGLACALINEVVHQCRPGMYCKAYTFFAALKDTIGAAAKETHSQVFKRFLHPDVLAVDEITVRSDSDWENTTLRELVDARFNEGKTTLMFGNLGMAEFNSYFEGAVVSRCNRSKVLGGGGIYEIKWGPLKFKPRNN
jgi:DNA replication protein DnaC